MFLFGESGNRVSVSPMVSAATAVSINWENNFRCRSHGGLGNETNYLNVLASEADEIQYGLGSILHPLFLVR